MASQKKRIVLFIILIVLIAGVRYSSLGTIFTFENLKQHRDSLLVMVQMHYWLSVLSFIGVYVLATALSLPGAVILTLAGGFLFGTVASVLYVNIGATTGAVCAFLAARYLVGNRLQENYQEQLRKFNAELERNGPHYLLTLRFIPLFPFFMINFLAGLTKIPLRTFIWTTSIGIIPGTAVFAFAGRQLGMINSPSDILSNQMLLVFAVLAAFTLFPVILKRIRGREQDAE
jgi:uncharacterized membrane protein YdjX (TVP38/TMEM64 family)